MFFLLCGADPLELHRRQHQPVAGDARRERQPDQEGLLPARAARRVDDRVAAGHVRDRARRGLRDPAHRRQHGAALDPGGDGADGAAHVHVARRGHGPERDQRLLPRRQALREHRAPGALLLGADRVPGHARSRAQHDPRRERAGSLPVQPEPDHPVHRSLPRRALQPALPELDDDRRISSAGRPARSRSDCGSSASSSPVWRRRYERDAGHHRRPRVEAVPPVPRAQPVAEGVGPARRPRALRGVLGARRRVVRGARGIDVRSDRRERVGQEHAAQVHRPHPAPRQGIDHGARQAVGAPRAGRGLPPRAVGPRERLPQRLDPRPEQEAARRALRRDRRLRRHRALHRHAGEELLVGHVRAARLLGRDQRRPRHAAHRRGPRGRRRRVPTQVHREDRRVPPARARRS